MHPDELATDEGLVRRLLAAPFPQWADLLHSGPFPPERVARAERVASRDSSAGPFGEGRANLDADDGAAERRCEDERGPA